MDRKRQNYQDYEVVVRIDKQNPDIVGGEHDGNDDLDVSTCDQIVTLEHVNDGTEDAVTDVRDISVADGCTRTARLRLCEQPAKQGTAPWPTHSGGTKQVSMFHARQFGRQCWRRRAASAVHRQSGCLSSCVAETVANSDFPQQLQGHFISSGTRLAQETRTVPLHDARKFAKQGQGPGQGKAETCLRRADWTKAVRSEEAARDSGSDKTAPTTGDMNKLLKENGS